MFGPENWTLLPSWEVGVDFVEIVSELGQSWQFCIIPRRSPQEPTTSQFLPLPKLVYLLYKTSRSKRLGANVMTGLEKAQYTTRMSSAGGDYSKSIQTKTVVLYMHGSYCGNWNIKTNHSSKTWHCTIFLLDAASLKPNNDGFDDRTQIWGGHSIARQASSIRHVIH